MKKIRIDNLRRGMVLGQDVYDPQNDSKLLLTRNLSLTEGMILMLRGRGVKSVLIRQDMASVFAVKSSLALPVDIEVPDPIITPELREDAIDSLVEVYEAFSISPDDIHESSRLIQHLDNVVEEIVDSLATSPNALVSITDLKSYDEYTYHHSLSVAVLGIAVAQHLGFDREMLRRLGMCAMLHDIGKISVPIEIINKTGMLDMDEINIIKTHPREGFDLLVKSGFKDDMLLRGVLHHHEKYDGTGYPDRIGGRNIPLYSRIISIADVYDALTSNRPYRIPMQPSEAVEYVMGNVNTAFDYETVFAFLHKVELYPIGSVVELSSGENAVVLSNESQLRPVVRTEAGETIDLAVDRRAYNIVVRRLLPPAEIEF